MSPVTAAAKELFLDALEQEGAAREALLDQRCASAPELREQVERLLNGHARRATVFGAERATRVPSDALHTGLRIGSYRSLEED